jgi:dienelactone hydrolase
MSTPAPPTFVLPIDVRAPERHGDVDLYPPEGAEPRPAVVLVHGGPLPAGLTPAPRDWPQYRGYASALAGAGVVAVMLNHRLHQPADYPLAADDVRAAVDLARADPRVDADRVALWFFSGGGLLCADWLRDPPGWLRCVALTYPVLAPLPGWVVDERFRPADAVSGAGTVPIVLTRVGRERPEIAPTVEPFVAAAGDCGARLDIIDVPNGQHAFDMLDHTDESRKAVERAIDSVLATLT